MLKFLGAVVIALALAGCQVLSTIEGTTISPTAMYVALNAYKAVERTGTNYVVYCTPAVKPAGCSAAAVQQIVTALAAGNVARNNLEAYIAANPGALGPVALYNALTTVTSTLSGIEAQYQVLPTAKP